MMQSFGIRFSNGGEISPRTADTAGGHELWMNSPGHRANILSATYNQIGCGVAKILQRHVLLDADVYQGILTRGCCTNTPDKEKACRVAF